MGAWFVDFLASKAKTALFLETNMKLFNRLNKFYNFVKL